jgi:hypothetical protein
MAIEDFIKGSTQRRRLFPLRSAGKGFHHGL